MQANKVILVTGVTGEWGGRVAARLITRAGQSSDEFYRGEQALHILGVDGEPPDPAIPGLDFIQADLRNPLIADLLRDERVDTVVHLAFQESLIPSEETFERNVLATMKLLGAAGEAGVRKFVWMSSTRVYGANPTNPAFLSENAPLQGSRAIGSLRDLIEIEAFCNGFQPQTPELLLTILRFPNILGPDVDTPFTRFLNQPLTPTLLGFDPLMQVIHADDVEDALLHSVAVDCPGVFNIAAEGVLPLSKLTALAGKIPFPVLHWLAYWGAKMLRQNEPQAERYAPLDIDSLRYSMVADLRRMRADLGFTPRYTAEEALREFAGQQRLRRYLPESASLAYDEQRLRDTLERRRRVRARLEDRPDWVQIEEVQDDNQ